jgi:hypothetical protein
MGGDPIIIFSKSFGLPVETLLFRFVLLQTIDPSRKRLSRESNRTHHAERGSHQTSIQDIKHRIASRSTSARIWALSDSDVRVWGTASFRFRLDDL